VYSTHSPVLPFKWQDVTMGIADKDDGKIDGIDANVASNSLEAEKRLCVRKSRIKKRYPHIRRL